VRGSHVRFFVVPDMLKNAPMFKNIGREGKGKGGGFGRGRGLVSTWRLSGARDQILREARYIPAELKILNLANLENNPSINETRDSRE
jgi:hypothetical protein